MGAGDSLTGRIGAFVAGAEVADTGSIVDTGSAVTAVLAGASAAAALPDATAPVDRVCVTAAVVRLGSDGGALLAGAVAVLGAMILPDTAGACAAFTSAVCGRAGSLGAASGGGTGSDLWAASTFGAACGASAGREA